MLEYSFNQLDNDFITVWCKYLLTGDKKLVMEEIRGLAEMGQINAIQAWYYFNKVGENETIDKLVETMGDSYNETYVRARIGAKDALQIEEHNRLLAFADEEHYVSGFRSGYYELTERAENSRKEIRELPFIDDYYSAISRAFQIGHRTNDILVLETANEMYSELSSKIGIDSYERDMWKKIKKINSEIISHISKSYKKEKKENTSFNPLNNPRICFAYVKAILLFNEKHREKDNAIKILKELANREYSCDLASKSKKVNK
jgi:hypothetical protein